MGLRDEMFWMEFESDVWKKGEGDRMEVEGLDEVEERFSL